MVFSLISSLSDEFNSALGRQWTWVREPAPEGYAISAESFDINTRPADLFEESDNASILSQAAPVENYIVETKVRLNLPLRAAASIVSRLVWLSSAMMITI